MGVSRFRECGHVCDSAGARGARDFAVGAMLEREHPEWPIRSAQRHFVRSTGITHRTLWQIERARCATMLLKQGLSILDTADAAGYFDQRHLTRSLNTLIGSTPAEISRGTHQLSFLRVQPAEQNLARIGHERDEHDAMSVDLLLDDEYGSPEILFLDQGARVWKARRLPLQLVLDHCAISRGARELRGEPLVNARTAPRREPHVRVSRIRTRSRAARSLRAPTKRPHPLATSRRTRRPGWCRANSAMSRLLSQSLRARDRQHEHQPCDGHAPKGSNIRTHCSRYSRVSGTLTVTSITALRVAFAGVGLHTRHAGLTVGCCWWSVSSPLRPTRTCAPRL